MLKNHPEMPSLVRTEFSKSVSALSDDFYMATVGGGKVQKVINMTGGPLRVRRVLEFNSKAEIEKEEALVLKRKQLGYGPGNKVGYGKREKTLADFVQELKRRKSGEALATVQWNPPPVEEVNFVEVSSSTRKKKRRRNTSELVACTKSLDSPCEHVIPQRDDETLSEYLKKSVGSTGRASSDNTCIKVFQRRKVKFKAIRGRALEAGTESANAGSKSRDKQSSTINLICENLCECEECQPFNDQAPKLASSLPGKSSMAGSTSSMVVSTTSSCEDQATDFPEIETSQVTSTVSDHQLENGGFSGQNDLTLERLSIEGAEKLSHPNTGMSKLHTPNKADKSSQLSFLDVPSTQEPAIHDTNDIEEITMELFRGEVAQQVPSSTDVTALGSRFSCGTSPILLHPGISVVERDLRPFDASNVGPDLRESDVQILSADGSSTSETFGTENLGSFSFGTESSTYSKTMPLHLEPTFHNLQSAAANSASVVTPIELEIAEERIGALLDTLVTPDDLLPVHLSASSDAVPESSKKKKRRRSFRETITVNMPTVQEGSCLGTMPVNNLGDDMTAPPSLDALQSVTEYVPSSGLDIMEEVTLSDTVESTDMSGVLISNQIQLVSEEDGIFRALGSSSEDTPTVCPTTVVAVLANVEGRTLLSAEEHCSNESYNLKAIEVIETPKSTRCNEEPGICQTSYAVSDGEERDNEDAYVGDISTLKVDLFSDLKSDGLSKRNRKSFSPNSRLALINAARSASEWIPTFRIKLSKSNLSDQCPSKVTSQKTVVREICSRPGENPTPDESSAPNEPQDLLDCNTEQIQLVVSAESDPLPLPLPPQTTENDSPSMDITSGPSSDSDSPEHTKEPRLSGESHGDMRAVNVDTTLTHTEGTLPIIVECHSGSPTGPRTPNEKLKPSEQPKSILKTGEVTCQGICKCPKCISTSDLSKVARKFMTSQMLIAEDITSKLLDEMRNMRTLLEADKKSPEDRTASTSCDFPSEKAKEALKSASKTEDWAIKEILKLSRDSKRVCRLIETGPRRTIFADDAGRQLEHVKILPAKKILKRVGSA